MVWAISIKRFRGDLEADGKGEMLSVMKGSAGYVAIERFVGHLSGKQGDVCCNIIKDGQSFYVFEYELS